MPWCSPIQAFINEMQSTGYLLTAILLFVYTIADFLLLHLNMTCDKDASSLEKWMFQCYLIFRLLLLNLVFYSSSVVIFVNLLNLIFPRVNVGTGC